MTSTIVSNKLANLKSDLQDTRKSISRYLDAGDTEMSRRVMRERCNEVSITKEIAKLEGAY